MTAWDDESVRPPFSDGGPFRTAPIFENAGTSNPLKFMAPGHFCPDVCGIEDFGPADYWRGRVVRAFFRLMRHWPKPGPRSRRIA